MTAVWLPAKMPCGCIPVETQFPAGRARRIGARRIGRTYWFDDHDLRRLATVMYAGPGRPVRPISETRCRWRRRRKAAKRS